jgi:Ricin-type beta-trefoil lectin domain/Glycosyl hydrolase family 12
VPKSAEPAPYGSLHKPKEFRDLRTKLALLTGRRLRSRLLIVCAIAVSLTGLVLVAAHTGVSTARRSYSPGPACLPRTAPYYAFLDERTANRRYVIDGDAWGLATTDHNDDRICVRDAGLGDAFTIYTSPRARSTNIVKAPRSCQHSCFRGIAAYPNISQYPSPIQVRHLGDTTASWALTPDTNSADAWDAVYDFLYSPSSKSDGEKCAPYYPATASTRAATEGGEVMVWLDSNHADSPAGILVSDTWVDGAYYKVYVRRPSASAHLWTIVSFVLARPATALANLDIGQFTRDAAIFARGAFSQSWYLCKISAGFEIWQYSRNSPSSGTDSFSVSDVTGPPSGRITSGLAGMCLGRNDSGTGQRNAVDISNCQDGDPAQQWTVESDGTIRDTDPDGDYCLDALGKPAAGSKVVLDPCASRPATSQQWLSAAGLLVSAATADSRQSLCLTAPSTPSSAQLTLARCTTGVDPMATASDQRWGLPYNGTRPVDPPRAGTTSLRLNDRYVGLRDSAARRQRAAAGR